MGEPAHRARLLVGYTWMKNNPTHPSRHAFLDRFLLELDRYTRLYGVIGEDGPPQPLPHKEIWRQEIADHMGFDDQDASVDALAGLSGAKKSPRQNRTFISDRS